MTKVISLTVLLYGKDFLGYALQSVLPAVDEAWILYTSTGSQSHRETAPCPETRDELLAIARAAAGDKLRWFDGAGYRNEGEHREMINRLVPDADVILVVDSDEIYADGLAQDAIDFALMAGVRRVRLPFTHLWRSFHRGFDHDPAYPDRVICPPFEPGETTMPTDKRVWHYGYAQNSQIVGWKWDNVHGHKNELRRDVNWYQDVFLANRQYDCHPVGSDAWNCEDIDLSHLPSVLETHPYRDLEVIP